VNPELVSIDSEHREGRLILYLRGDIDLSNAQRLQQRIQHAVAGESNVVLDLTSVAYIDSQGLRLLSQLSKSLSRQGSTFQLIAYRGTFVRSVLELTHIDEDVEVLDTIDDARGRPTPP